MPAVAMVTDYDCWHEDHGAVDVSAVIATLMANADAARNTVARLPALLPERERLPAGLRPRAEPCDHDRAGKARSGAVGQAGCGGRAGFALTRAPVAAGRLAGLVLRQAKF